MAIVYPSASHDPNRVFFDAFPHGRMKSGACRDCDRKSECLSNLVLNLHQANEIGNFDVRIVVDEKVEIAVRPFGAAGAGTEEKDGGGALSRNWGL